MPAARPPQGRTSGGLTPELPVSDETNRAKPPERTLDESRKTLRPEFLNRRDDVIVLRLPTKPDLIQILDLETTKVRGRLKQQYIPLQFAAAAKEFLVKQDDTPQCGSGAREAAKLKS